MRPGDARTKRGAKAASLLPPKPRQGVPWPDTPRHEEAGAAMTRPTEPSYLGDGVYAQPDPHTGDLVLTNGESRRRGSHEHHRARSRSPPRAPPLRRGRAG